MTANLCTEDEMFTILAWTGGHGPSEMQVVDPGKAWCPTCGDYVRMPVGEVEHMDSSAAELLKVFAKARR